MRRCEVNVGNSERLARLISLYLKSTPAGTVEGLADFVVRDFERDANPLAELKVTREPCARSATSQSAPGSRCQNFRAIEMCPSCTRRILQQICTQLDMSRRTSVSQ